ncbi:MAG: glycoside hydrolase family 65 protein [Chitinivibrionales bacterium]|nr:glycoside hydrolase family 65 protein [Chitinivibrionales bacterium]
MKERKEHLESPWHISENSFNPSVLRAQETVFTTGNGYCGVRGSFEEGYPGDNPTTMIAGVYDKVPLENSEMANVPNPLYLVLYINGERFRMDRGELLDYSRILNMKNGMLTRTVRWRSPEGDTVDLAFERFASLADPHCIAIKCSATPVDFSGTIEFRSGIYGYMVTEGRCHWRPCDQGSPDRQSVYLHTAMLSGEFELCEAAQFTVDGAQDVVYDYCDCDFFPFTTARASVRKGETITAQKLVSTFTSRDTAGPQEAARSHLSVVCTKGYDKILSENNARWDQVWDRSNITIEGDDEADRAVRYNIFQLLIAAPWNDEKVSFAVKTLSGLGYRNHVLWEAETCMSSLFICTQPEVARNALMYRYHTLDGARKKAKKYGCKGAMFPWEGDHTGDEKIPSMVPHHYGELIPIPFVKCQIHNTSGVGWAVMQYWNYTGDDDFMREYGVELLVEIARFWSSRSTWNEHEKRYEIIDVIGPDEYHWHVNNNTYTNYMAKWNIEQARAALSWLEKEFPEKAEQLKQRCELTKATLQQWNDIIALMYWPYNTVTGLMEQFDGYFSMKNTLIAEYEPRSIPMSVVLGLDGMQKSQIIKQADVIMLCALLKERFDPKTLRANYEYYAPRTDLTHGSAMAPPFYALVAARCGKVDEAYRHFMHAARMDLDDLKGDGEKALHASCLGGTWQAVIFGFCGFQLTEDGYSTDPNLPKHWKRISFTCMLRGKKVRIAIDNTGMHSRNCKHSQTTIGA